VTRKIRSFPAALIKPVGNISAEGQQNGTCKYTLLCRAGFCPPSSGKVTFWYLNGHEQQAVWDHSTAFGEFLLENLRCNARYTALTLRYSQLPPYRRNVKRECHQPDRYKLKIFKRNFTKGYCGT